MIAIGLVLLGVYFFSFQTCGFYGFIVFSRFIPLFGFMTICRIYDICRRFMRINKYRFHDYYLLFYFGKFGYYNLVSERDSVPAPTRDGDLWDFVLIGFWTILKYLWGWQFYKKNKNIAPFCLVIFQ